MLLTGNGQNQSQVTGSGQLYPGYAYFSNLPPGVYTVTADFPTDWAPALWEEGSGVQFGLVAVPALLLTVSMRTRR